MKSFLKNKQCGQGIRKAAVLTAAIVSLSAASVSWAASITIDNRTFVNGSQSGNISVAGGVLAGQFNFNVTSPATLGNVTWNSTLQAFCIDINNSIKNPATYNIVAATDVGGLTNLQLSQVGWLFDNHGSSLGSSSQFDAAFQLTLWEIFFETGPTFNLNNGSFEAESGFSGARATANAWLSGVPTSDDYTSEKWEFYTLNPTNPQNNQRLITWREKDPSQPPQEISEPGTPLLLSIGLGVAFFSIRRRNGMQFASLA